MSRTRRRILQADNDEDEARPTRARKQTRSQDNITESDEDSEDDQVLSKLAQPQTIKRNSRKFHFFYVSKSMRFFCEILLIFLMKNVFSK